MKKIILLCVVLVAALSSCGKSNENCVDEITAFSSKFQTALTNYANDESVANCKAYKSVLQEYVDLIDDCTNNTVITKAQLDELRKEVNSLECK